MPWSLACTPELAGQTAIAICLQRFAHTDLAAGANGRRLVQRQKRVIEISIHNSASSSSRRSGISGTRGHRRMGSRRRRNPSSSITAIALTPATPPEYLQEPEIYLYGHTFFERLAVLARRGEFPLADGSDCSFVQIFSHAVENLDVAGFAVREDLDGQSYGS